MEIKRKWSNEAWQAAEHIYKAILDLPFVKQLADGTLDKEKFLFYLNQDAMYIENYCRVLAHIASRLHDKSMTEAFLDFAADGVAVEKAMHDIYLACAERTAEMSPSCLLYCSVLNACANDAVEVEAAAVLPCFWVYNKVGKHIAAMVKDGNPFSEWIDTYSDPAFDLSNDRAIALCDALAEAAGEDTRRRMTEIFVLCTKMEWLFWDSAFNLEKWKI